MHRLTHSAAPSGHDSTNSPEQQYQQPGTPVPTQAICQLAYDLWSSSTLGFSRPPTSYRLSMRMPCAYSFRSMEGDSALEWFKTNALSLRTVAAKGHRTVSLIREFKELSSPVGV